MAPRPRWWHQLQASKHEALLAVDLYNRAISSGRAVEAFIVHMAIAWLKLLQAAGERDRRDFYIRGAGGRRRRGRDGEFQTLSLSEMVARDFAENDPRRKNVEFFLGFRHRIEHRYDRDVATLVAGKARR